MGEGLRVVLGDRAMVRQRERLGERVGGGKERSEDCPSNIFYVRTQTQGD